VTTMSLVAATPKPRLVKLEVSAEGEDSFLVGEAERKATKFVVKIKIKGVAGAVAPLVGKEPPDRYVWVSTGEAPTFLKSEGPLSEGGPAWRVEVTSATWTKESRK
jgi:hypothetical protein